MITRNENGMATGIVMIIAILMSSIAISILALNRENNVRDLRYALFHSMLDIVHANLYAFGQNERAWNATVAFNQAALRMTCINSGSNCNHNAKEDIVLRYPTNATTGSIYYDERHYVDTVHDGFRLDGSVCDFDDAAANLTEIKNGCLLRVRVRWQPFCTSDCEVGPDSMIFDLAYSMPKKDQFGRDLSQKDFFLPLTADKEDGPIPIFNPYR